MMKQYLAIKERYRDCILFFRMGDFYEMFFEDAVTAAPILEIALTTRDKNKKDPIPMCGVPCHSAGTYIQKLLERGYKVAICEQVGEPGSGKIMERDVTRVVTPGVPVEEGVDPKESNHLLSIYPGKGGFGIACVDPTTGEGGLTEARETLELESEINRLEPKEILLPGDDDTASLLGSMGIQSHLTILEEGERDHFLSLERCFGKAWVRETLSLGMERALKAMGLLIQYLKDTRKVEPHYLRPPMVYRLREYMVLDRGTMKNLEILESIRDRTRKGSLLHVLDRTRTAMGGRLIKKWLAFPLLSRERIDERLEAVEELKEEREARRGIANELKGMYDLERLVNKVVVGVAGPRDLVSLAASLKRVPALSSLLEGFRSTMIRDLRRGLKDWRELVDLIEGAIVDDPPPSIRDGGVIRDGFSAELDELRLIKRSGKEWLLELERKERERTGIASLKVGYNRVFGYYIEVTRSNLSRVPADYIRKQTLVNAERFITPELKDYESRILQAEERTLEVEERIFREILERIGHKTKEIQETAASIATLDVLLSLADVADEYDYVRPRVDEEGTLFIREGRHPVVERMMDEPFVPNDTFLDGDSNRLLVITGPNMAGKSTYLRQVALITLMAQVGSFVPAREARIGIVDRIFARIGAMDDISRGQSTFMVEMCETAHILRFATPRSLIILDEIGRGTSTFDGISIAWAVAEYIHDHLKAKTLFATHYHELTDLALTKEGVRNYNVSVKEWGDRVIFLRRIKPGGMNRSYGIQVARLAGIPEGVIRRAKEILSNLEREELDNRGLPRFSGPSGKGVYQMSLFAPVHPVIDEIKRLNPDNITPLEALKKLYHLKGLVEDDV